MSEQRNESSAAYPRAIERLRTGAQGQQTPGSPEVYVALYEEHCKALLNEIERLHAAHDAKSGALQTVYRLATSGTGVTGTVMQQIADAAYSAFKEDE